MKKTTTWTVTDMLEYAFQKYALKDEYNSFWCYDSTETCKREIRRKLVDCKLVMKDKDTDKYVYELPEEIAKTFIDITMKDYFTDPVRFDKEEATKRYLKRDKKLNKEYFDRFAEEQGYLLDCYENGVDPYAEETVVTQDEIEKSILTMMIKTLFGKFYYFDEKQYIKDYIELKSLMYSIDYEKPLQDGYSYLKNKLDNPVVNYCTPKK